MPQQTLDTLRVRAPIESFIGGTTSRPVSMPATDRPVEPSPSGPLSLLTAPVRYGAWLRFIALVGAVCAATLVLTA